MTLVTLSLCPLRYLPCSMTNPYILSNLPGALNTIENDDN